ncbi:MAG: alpha-galactosidase, partial [Flavobacteriales bacterium]
MKIEKAILMGHLIRKLDEAQKTPPEFLKTQESISLYKSKGTIVDFMNWHHLERHLRNKE